MAEEITNNDVRNMIHEDGLYAISMDYLKHSQVKDPILRQMLGEARTILSAIEIYLEISEIVYDED